MASADQRVNVGSDDSGVTVHVSGTSKGTGGHTSHAPARPRRPSGCARRLVPAAEPRYLRNGRPGPPMPPAPTLASRPYHVYCGSRYVTSIWVTPGAPSNATDLLAHLDFPVLHVGVNPTTGLTGLATWFWIDGYDGHPLTLTRSGDGISIDVEVSASALSWDFGDGTVVTAGYGRPYPQHSDVSHTYERRGTYTITVSYAFHARYRVNGGSWADIDPVDRVASLEYTVREVRSVLTA